jgi:hypothetical protein
MLMVILSGLPHKAARVVKELVDIVRLGWRGLSLLLLVVVFAVSFRVFSRAKRASRRAFEFDCATRLPKRPAHRSRAIVNRSLFVLIS